MPDFPTITHVALTVSDLDRSVPWYQRLFDADPVLDEDTGPFRHVVWLIGSTLVGLHQFPDPAAGEFFDSIAQFYRRAYLRYIDATKRRPEERAARIAEVVALLAAGIKQR